MSGAACKAKVTLKEGIVEIEGTKAFVGAQLELFKEQTSELIQENFNPDAPKYELDTRSALLQYFSSASGAHVNYLLTLAIGFFAVIQAVPYIPQIELGGYSLKPATVIAILSLFLTTGAYLIARMLYYSAISGYSLYVKLMSCKEAEDKNVTKSPLDRLTYSCIEFFEDNNKILTYFVGSNIKRRCDEKNRKHTFLMQLLLFGFICAVLFVTLYLGYLYGVKSIT